MREDGLIRASLLEGRHRLGNYAQRAFDRLLLRRLDGLLQERGEGRLVLTMPNGRVSTLGRADISHDVSLEVRRYRALWKIMRGGALGFAESWMDGEVEVEDLRAVFEFYYANEAALTGALPSLQITRSHDRLLHALRRNTRSGSRRNIAAHYDLGNDFYRLWLDASMSYSSGLYRHAGQTLEEAQQQKIASVLDALDIRPGHSMLEIGCGWGALAEAAGARGAKVDAVTISAEQHAASRARIAAAGLGDRVNIRFEDYRDTKGTFDRLVSIEMIEAVGEQNWPLYFDTLARRLRPGGRAVIQAITIREDAFDLYRANPDFIQRYIFPGGMLPTVELIRARSKEAGLVFQEIERFGVSYAETLREWRRRFLDAWPRIEALGFDRRFRRMWEYYLTYCEVGFERGLIDVGLYRLDKPLAPEMATGA